MKVSYLLLNQSMQPVTAKNYNLNCSVLLFS